MRASVRTMPTSYPKPISAKHAGAISLFCSSHPHRTTARLSAMADQGARLSVVVNDGGWTIEGEIDAFSAPTWASAFATMPATSLVVADFAGVTFMDSSGLRALVDAAAAAAAAGKKFAISNPQTAIRRVVEISGLSDHVHFVD